MGIKAWMSRLFGGEKKALLKEVPQSNNLSSSIAKMDQEVMGLNFKEAIEAHQNWKKRLRAVVDGNSAEELIAEVISRDDQCILGKWIYTEGDRKFSSLAKFEQLKQNHAKFHVCAGDVLRLAQAKNHKDALQELDNGEYARSSLQVIRDLVSIHIHAKNSA